MFLLDTNVISELRKIGDGKADKNVINWISSINANQLYLSVITILELERGILRVAHRDQIQGQRLRQWLDEYILPQFDSRILPIDLAIIKQCARLHIPDPKPECNALIAATALVHGFSVVTRNSKDFSSSGVNLINPWHE